MSREHTRRFSSRDELLAYVASLYHQSGQSQSQIARELQLSPSMISRMLHEAFEKNIIEIHIRWPVSRLTDLEEQVCASFGLHAARVLDAGQMSYPQLVQQLGSLAATEFTNRLNDNMAVGIAWGTAIWEVIRAVRPGMWNGIRVIQCIGALSRTTAVSDSPLLAEKLAQRLGGVSRHLHAPLLVDTPDICQALLRDSTIRETLNLARQVDIAILGIGSVVPELSSLKRAGYLSDHDLAELRALGAVGDICARYYDAAGQPISATLNERTVGVTLADVAAMPYVIGVAGGVQKAAAIAGALRGGYLNMLVTDRAAAEQVLRGVV